MAELRIGVVGAVRVVGENLHCLTGIDIRASIGPANCASVSVEVGAVWGSSDSRERVSYLGR